MCVFLLIFEHARSQEIAETAFYIFGGITLPVIALSVGGITSLGLHRFRSSRLYVLAETAFYIFGGIMLPVIALSGGGITLSELTV